MLMQPNVVLIILKYLGKRCQTYYMRGVFFIGLMIQKLQGIIAFLVKIKSKTGIYATSILLNV